MGRDAAAAEPVAQPFATSSLPALDRPDRPAQMPGRLLVAAALEVAEDQRGPESLRQPLDLFVEHAFELVVRLDAGFRPERRPAPFMPVPTGRGQSGTRRRPKGDLMEPRPQRIAHPEPPGLLHQNQKGGLKRILTVVRIDQDAPAYPQDHRPMSFDQGRERQFGGLAAAGREPLQELTIGQLADRPQIEKVRSCLTTAPCLPIATGVFLRGPFFLSLLVM